MKMMKEQQKKKMEKPNLHDYIGRAQHKGKASLLSSTAMKDFCFLGKIFAET